jgi:hypothetical protein
MSGIVVRLTQTAEYTVEYDVHECDVCVIRAYAPFLLAGFDDGSIKVWELEVRYSFRDRVPPRCVDNALSDRLVQVSTETRNPKDWRLPFADCVRLVCVCGIRRWTDMHLGYLCTQDPLFARARGANLRQTGHMIACLEGHNGAVLALVVNSHYLVSGGTDGAVRTWDLIVCSPLSICSMFCRGLTTPHTQTGTPVRNQQVTHRLHHISLCICNDVLRTCCLHYHHRCSTALMSGSPTSFCMRRRCKRLVPRRNKLLDRSGTISTSAAFPTRFPPDRPVEGMIAARGGRKDQELLMLS